MIHAPGWSDAQVAERLVPALAVLDGPAAPDAMALTAALDERALASSVHAVLTRREDVLAGVPHVERGRDAARTGPQPGARRADHRVVSVAVPQRYVPAEARPMADGLQLLHDVLAGTELHRRYWLFGGVVLGIVREGGLMAHDAVDVDFALLASDAWRFEAALPALFAAGFEPMFVFPGGDRPPTSWALRRGSLKFDFMLLEVAGDRFRYKNYALHGGAPSYRVCEIPAQPLEDVAFLEPHVAEGARPRRGADRAVRQLARPRARLGLPQRPGDRRVRPVGPERLPVVAMTALAAPRVAAGAAAPAASSSSSCSTSTARSRATRSSPSSPARSGSSARSPS